MIDFIGWAVIALVILMIVGTVCCLMSEVFNFRYSVFDNIAIFCFSAMGMIIFVLLFLAGFLLIKGGD